MGSSQEVRYRELPTTVQVGIRYLRCCTHNTAPFPICLHASQTITVRIDLQVATYSVCSNSLSSADIGITTIRLSMISYTARVRTKWNPRDVRVVEPEVQSLCTGALPWLRIKVDVVKLHDIRSSRPTSQWFLVHLHPPPLQPPHPPPALCLPYLKYEGKVVITISRRQ